MARLLALDYGKRRTGIAVSDPLQLIANGLSTVDTSSLLEFLADYLKREKVETIVVGLPMQLNGQPSENMERVGLFVNRLRKLYPQIPVVYYDERFTSSIAKRTMISGGVKKQKRRNKALVDKISATVILQDYMESRRLKV